MNMTENQALSEQERKWRSPSKPLLPLENQHDAFSSGNPENRERDRNNPSNCKTDLAARWLASQAVPPRPIVPNLRRAFDLTPKQACEVIRMANELRWAK